ncbi:MAG TPA: hypothetical protein VGS23_06080 [Thermoplasmata archaeon]|nr:hypothetical protein [Thermoplasmata archaeon]HEV2316685.1 hypothetical protein [Thermoplasmata archaeon]
MEVTVDTNVLVRSGVKSDPARPACFVFLHEFKAREDLVLALDDEELVEREYRAHLNPMTYGHHWLRTILLMKARTKLLKRAELPPAVRAELLDECHLDPPDLNLFVRVALASKEKLIVTHDGDYWRSSRRCLKRRLKIEVESAKSVHPKLCGGQWEDCRRRVMGG